MHVRRIAIAVIAALACAAACTPAPHAPRWADVLEATPPFLANTPAFDPSLEAAPGGRVALTWVTRDTSGADLWIAFSADSGGHFTPPARINLRHGRVSSYPESRPVAVLSPNGRVVVAWAAARDSGRFADDIVSRASEDGGATFGPETLLNDDRALPGSTYHGFVALDATPQGRVFAAWVDGRATALAAGEAEPAVAEIWSATSDDGGASWSANRRVASGVCPCCRISLRASAARVVLAYRSVRDSVRDPRLAVSHDGGATFTFDTLVSADGWKLAGCPSTGPALTLSRDGGWLAWFTGAGGADGVRACTWRDGHGATMAPAALDDTLHQCAHPMLANMGSATLAGVLARAGATRRVLALRMLGADGEFSPWLLLGANARSATIAAEDARHALAAWVEQSDAGPRVRVVRVTRR
jgi:hypothetical protein